MYLFIIILIIYFVLKPNLDITKNYNVLLHYNCLKDNKRKYVKLW